MVREYRVCERAKGIVGEFLEELEYLKQKISGIEDDLDNAIAKTTDEEIKKDLSYVYTQLEDLVSELKDYCPGDCLLCTKNCDIECSVDCYMCVRFFKCISEKKVSRMVFD
jgi:hypothetical protein